MKVFPNPGNGNFTVTGVLNEANGNTVALTIYDMTGKAVYNAETKITSNTINEQIIAADLLSEGSYVLSLGNSYIRINVQK